MGHHYTKAAARAGIIGAAAALLAGLLGAQPATAAHQHRAPGDTVTTTLYSAIDALPVADEDRTGYERTKFRHWIDADRDGCDTRREVILEEALEAPEVGPKCAMAGGLWLSLYDNVLVTDQGGLDVDHLVPLAEAWDSGASGWTAAERQRYANDLDEPRALIAVTGKTNRSKADKDVSQWLPPAAGYHCTYAADWTAIKTRWGLNIDQREADALHRIASGCEDAELQVVLAR
ncbi:HNH endonuclease family protein [Kitasatospora purpeofusca]|uniref:HNH endonuclease family protein n=1 Tax=Kitasatospora purpeofusca TaxID=67352 RepID=UPI0038308A6B